MKRSEYINRLRAYQNRIEGSCTLCAGNLIPHLDCSCRAKFEEGAKFLFSGIPERYLDLEFVNLKKNAALKLILPKIHDYVLNLPENLRSGNGLYISSDVAQVGKSTLSHIILKTAIRQGYSAYVTDVRECASVFDNREFNAEEAAFLQDRMFNSDLMLVDPLGDFNELHNTPPFVRQSFKDVYIRRASNNKATIIASHLAPDRIVDIFGLPFYETILNNSDFIHIPDKGN